MAKELVVSKQKVVELIIGNIKVFRKGSRFTLEVDGKAVITSTRVSAVLSELGNHSLAVGAEKIFSMSMPTVTDLRGVSSDFSRFDVTFR